MKAVKLYVAEFDDATHEETRKSYSELRLFSTAPITIPEIGDNTWRVQSERALYTFATDVSKFDRATIHAKSARLLEVFMPFEFAQSMLGAGEDDATDLTPKQFADNLMRMVGEVLGRHPPNFLTEAANSQGVAIKALDSDEVRYTPVDVTDFGNGALLPVYGGVINPPIRVLHATAPVFVTEGLTQKARDEGYTGMWQFDRPALAESNGDDVQYAVVEKLRVLVRDANVAAPGGRFPVPEPVFRSMTEDEPAEWLYGYNNALSFLDKNCLPADRITATATAN